MPLIFSFWSRRYVISGSTRSTPSISASGNVTPPSTALRSSSCSSTHVLRPTAPAPPRGVTRNLFFAIGFAVELLAGQNDVRLVLHSFLFKLRLRPRSAQSGRLSRKGG